MIQDTQFPDIDTSYWKTKDTQWMVERKAKWPAIEAMLKNLKPKKAINAIRQYYLKGSLPDWEKFADWDNSDRHVDLFIFIWLHPSWDDEVLIPLRNAYMHSGLIVMGDLKAGIANFLSCGISFASYDYSDLDVAGINEYLFTEHHNEQLFRILMGDLAHTHCELDFKLPFPPWSQKQIFEVQKAGLGDICTMGKWLCIKDMHPRNKDMLFQYDQPLEWWYQSCEKDEDYFKRRANERSRPYLQKALWRIHHFDAEREGDTCRTRFVHKIRKILDERSFIKDIEDMWKKVKEGKIQVKHPWEID